MENGKNYVVTTHWGCFSMDEQSYRDYLAGKLWLSWEPGNRTRKSGGMEDRAATPDVTKEALELRDRAERSGILTVLKANLWERDVHAPYRTRMADISIEELPLSVRAYNGMKRAGINTFGELHAQLRIETGLYGLRNIGAKSVAEITAAFTMATNRLLTAYEKAAFWQEKLDDCRNQQR